MLEFDLKELTHRKCRELEKYVNECIEENKKKMQREQQLKEL